MPTIEQARQTIHDFWMAHDEVPFAKEVLTGVWDHRSDVRAALENRFDPQVMEDRIAWGTNKRSTRPPPKAANA